MINKAVIFFTMIIVVQNVFADMAIFGDEVLSSGNYGRSLIDSCLKNQIQSNEQIALYSDRGAKVNNIINHINSRQPLYGLRNSNSVTNDIKLSQRAMSEYFFSASNNANIKSFMFFVGQNHSGNPSEAQSIRILAQRMTALGKECVFVLPPFIRIRSKEEQMNVRTVRSNRINEERRNNRILQSNRMISNQMAGTNCKVVDPGRTLEENSSINFFSSDGNNIDGSEMEKFVQASCDAIQSLRQPSAPNNVQKTVLEVEESNEDSTGSRH